MKNLILCGGAGTRLWPLSRSLMPKQFYPLIENKSLFEMTVLRNKEISDKYIIAVNSSQYFLATDQLLGLNINNFSGILEPVGRNTAPAIALAAMTLEPEDIILVTPSDQLILNNKEYRSAVSKAEKLAEQDYIVTFGITPHSPETGFGYIEAKGDEVLSFKEKPTYEQAVKYLKNGNYLWNSGMFCFKAGVFLDELRKYAPKVYNSCHDCFCRSDKYINLKPDPEFMLKIPSISIDYAVMEHSKRVKVISCDLDWSDLGSFDSLYKQLAGEKDNNALVGSENEIIINSSNNLIMAGKRKVACIDVDNLIIVDSEDALLVARRGSSQKVRNVVEELKKISPYLLEAPLTVKRPWGSYTVLQNPSTYKVKRIEIKPGKRLSLQYHKRREEHWTFVQGEGKVRIGDDVIKMKRHDHAVIPVNTIHRVENICNETLIFIETQLGSYFGEDDIIRIEDDWGRC